VDERNQRLKPLKRYTSSNPADTGWFAVRTRPLIAERGTPGPVLHGWPGGHGESLRRNRGDAAGASPSQLAFQAGAGGKARCLLMAARRGGGPVVVRARVQAAKYCNDWRRW